MGIYVIVIVVWFSIGVATCIYVITEDDDFTTKDLLPCILFGFTGLLSLLTIIIFEISDSLKGKVLFKKRK